jgi:DNA-binding NarL/FixJ family response regulator
MPATVLLVEEHDELRAALRDWLRNSLPELQLREARTLEEALRLAEQAKLDFALVNVELPEASGITALRAIHALHPDLLLVAMSLQDSAALRSVAHDAGAAEFITKRELPSRLLPLVQRLLVRI